MVCGVNGKFELKRLCQNWQPLYIYIHIYMATFFNCERDFTHSSGGAQVCTTATIFEKNIGSETKASSGVEILHFQATGRHPTAPLSSAGR